MPVRAQALTMHYFATDADGPKTGDVGNHALRIIEDGVIGTIAGSPAEIDATNAPGMYKVAITAAENTADVVTLCGKSSSSGVTISPSTWCNITNADVNAAAGASYASANTTALTTIDGIVDAILVDTGTTLNDKIDVIDGIVDSILVDTGTTLDGKINTVDTVVDAIKVAADAILVDTGTTIPATLAAGIDVLSIAGNTNAATLLSLTAKQMVEGTVDTGSFTATTNQFQSDTGGLSSVDDHYVGRLCLWTSGTLQYQVADITDYDGTNKRFTCTDLTSAPANDVTFVLV